MRALDEFCGLPPEFWALVKLASQKLGYSERGTGRIKRYDAERIADVLRGRGLDPSGHEPVIGRAAAYVTARADLLEQHIKPNLMDREQARASFEEIRARVSPPAHLLVMNKQRGDKRHEAYLTCIVNALTYDSLRRAHGEAVFDSNPKSSLTFALDGMPHRTLYRRMDGAYPNANHPHAAWEIKEHYGTKTFGSRVSAAVYETALDGYELNELNAAGVKVDHYLFVDDRFTWWKKGRPYFTRIVDMFHAGLLDGAFFGREVMDAWPAVVTSWPAPSPAE